MYTTIHLDVYQYCGYPNLSINDLVVPSAPPTEQERGSQVNWEVLPQADNPKWHQITKIRQVVTSWALSLSLLTGLGALYAAVWLKAKPIVVLYTFSGLGVVTIALVVTGLALSRLAPHPLDRDFRMSQRKLAQREDQNGTLTFEKREIYGETIVLNREWQDLLHLDIWRMTYSEFITKHNESVLLFLNEENKSALMSKYIVHLTTKEVGLRGVKEILEGDKVRYFDVKIDVFARDFVAAELCLMFEKGTSYEEFIKRNGLEVVSYALNSNYRDGFIRKFIDNVDERMRGEGSIEAERLFSEDFKVFGEFVQKATLEFVARHSLCELGDKKIDYSTFRQRTSLSHLKRLITEFREVKEIVKRSYMALPFDLMKKYSLDRDCLEISLEEWEECLFGYWNQIPIQDILKDQELEFEFFEIVKELFSPFDWSRKIVQETSKMTIQQILAMSPTLLTSKILTLNTILASGKSFKDQLKEELSVCDSLEFFVSNYPAKILYSEGVLLKNDQKMVALAVDFMVRHSSEYLLGFEFAISCQKKTLEFIRECISLPQSVNKVSLKYKREIMKEDVRFEECKERRKNNLKTILDQNAQEKREALIKLKEDCQIDSLKKRYAKAKGLKEAAERKLADLKETKSAIEQDLDSRAKNEASLSQLIAAQRKQQAELELLNSTYADVKNSYLPAQEGFNTGKDFIENQFNLSCEKIKKESDDLAQVHMEEHIRIYTTVQKAFEDDLLNALVATLDFKQGSIPMKGH